MQGRFLPRYDNNRPDSSEDTPESSSPRSFQVIGSLLNGNDMNVEKIITFMFCISLFRPLRKKKVQTGLFLKYLKVI